MVLDGPHSSVLWVLPSSAFQGDTTVYVSRRYNAKDRGPSRTNFTLLVSIKYVVNYPECPSSISVFLVDGYPLAIFDKDLAPRRSAYAQLRQRRSTRTDNPRDQCREP
jgi:hypothetical protein